MQDILLSAKDHSFGKNGELNFAGYEISQQFDSILKVFSRCVHTSNTQDYPLQQNTYDCGIYAIKVS